MEGKADEIWVAWTSSWIGWLFYRKARQAPEKDLEDWQSKA